MLEILFRGKSVNLHNGSKDFVYGQYVQNRDGKMIYSDTWEDGIQKHYVIEKTVGQYTGLTDKNGNKIFEGDIFFVEDDMPAVVIFKDGCFRLQVYGLVGTYTESGYDEVGGGFGIVECEPIDWYYIHNMQVIGNIHDNPELLKGGTENGRT